MRRINIELHPLSALFGALLVVGTLGVISAGRTPTVLGDLQRVAVVNPLTVEGAYDPKEAVVIRDGISYTVPANKILVLTALGRAGAGTSPAQLRIDGIGEVRLIDEGTEKPYEAGIRPLPPGLTASAGSVVSVDSGASGSDARAWGYLVDR